MRLQQKLMACFAVMVAISLVVSLVGYFEVRRLGLALYEVGTVRLPSIEGLAEIHEAQTELVGSLRVLMTANTEPGLVEAETDRQRSAWERAREGWDLYAPLPQSAEEAVVWRKFVAAWSGWKKEYENLAARVARSYREGDPALLEQAREDYAAMRATHFDSVAGLLDRLLAINRQIADEAKAQSIAKREDMVRVQWLMIVAAMAGVLSAAGLGVAMGRRLSRPLAEAVRVLAQIARGDFSRRMVVSSRDEIGEMAAAMNSMAQTLQDSEAKFLEIFRHSTDGLFFVQVTVDGRFLYEASNPAAMRANGLAGDDLRGRDIRELFPASAAAQMTANFQRCVAASSPIGFEEEIEFAPGRRCFNTLLVPVRNETGRVVRIAEFARDVTERRQAERTRHVLEGQLRQAQKLEVVGQLTAGVAHDFSNLLAAIMLHLDIVRSQAGLAPAIRADLEQLREGARRGVSLTRQLLLFSRKAVMRREVVNLNSLFTDLLKMLRRLIGEQVEIEFVPADEEPLVQADAGMLEQVVMNLIVNARDAMPEGGRVTLAVDHVELEAGRVRTEPATAGLYVRLRVTDTGCGMSPAVLERIFEPFFTTKDPNKGSGLGLATVFGIAQEHGGWVEVESEVGRGSVLTVFLPTVRGLVNPPRPEALWSGVEPGGAECLLVAEDDRNLRLATVLILRNQGYTVFEAPDEITAKAILGDASLHVDLLLADLALPGGIFGRRLADVLDSRRQRPKVVLMSGSNLEMRTPPGLGECTYLPKPFDSSQLLRTVRACLDGRSGEVRPGAGADAATPQ